MASTTARLDTVAAMQDLTFNVRLVRVTELRYRVKLGLWLIRLACRVMNCNVLVEGSAHKIAEVDQWIRRGQ